MSRVDFDGTGSVETDDEADWRERLQAASVRFDMSLYGLAFENNDSISEPKPIARHMLRMWFGDNADRLIGKPLTTIEFMIHRKGEMIMMFGDDLSVVCVVDRSHDARLHEDGLMEELETTSLELSDEERTPYGTRLTFKVPRVFASDFAHGMMTMGTGVLRSSSKIAYRNAFTSTFLRR